MKREELKIVLTIVLLLAARASAQATKPSGFDVTKCGPMAHQLKVWDPVGTDTLSNYLTGEFIATQGASDPHATPPKVKDGKGILTRIRTTHAGDIITYRNCGGWDIGRENATVMVGGLPQVIGTHTDFLWVVSDKSATGITLRIIDCYVGHVEGETIHIEGGSYESIELVRVATNNVIDGQAIAGNKVTIKVMPGCKIKRVVADGCSTNLYFDTTALQGADPGTVLESVYVNNHLGGYPTYLGSTKIHINDLPDDMKGPVMKPQVVPATKPFEDRELWLAGKRYRLMDAP